MSSRPPDDAQQLMSRARVSVVVPVLNDASPLAGLLAHLQHAWPQPCALEVIVVDGGSSDESARIACDAGARLLRSAPGRGRQLAVGSRAATAGWLWMLHADTRPSAACMHYLCGLDDVPAWGRFSVTLGAHGLLPLVAALMNLRSRLSGVCTGDQGIFVHRELLAAAGGMPPQPLMEDIELSVRLKRLARPRCRPETVAASPRRWLRDGVLRTVLGMWGFRLRYWLGADPERLAREYYHS